MIEGILYLLMALGWITLFLKKERNFMRIEARTVAKFIGFMGILSLWRYFAITKLGFLDPDMIEVSKQIFFPSLLLVFLEDAFFVLPIVACKKFRDSNVITYTVAAFFSLLFASAHLYQGLGGFFFALFYMHMSYKYSHKHGMGTVMICHILYDICTLALFRFLI